MVYLQHVLSLSDVPGPLLNFHKALIKSVRRDFNSNIDSRDDLLHGIINGLVVLFSYPRFVVIRRGDPS